ncbi:MAG: hypothetical protein HY318_12375, partial [Armatimonadetes bacterium]|nr:hypothetical protein [Armatimonadota bacterium]
MPARKRNVDLYDVLQYWCKNWKPDCAFDGTTEEDFQKWRKAFARHYRNCLGPWPGKVPLDIEVVERVDKGDYVREKVLFDSSWGVTVPAYLLTPKGLKKGERRAGILAAHGHGNGKADICGVTREIVGDEGAKTIEALNYEYAVAAVQRGYVVIAPDWCPFGERLPPQWWSREGRDSCNVAGLAWQYFGRPL